MPKGPVSQPSILRNALAAASDPLVDRELSEVAEILGAVAFGADARSKARARRAQLVDQRAKLAAGLADLQEDITAAEVAQGYVLNAFHVTIADQLRPGLVARFKATDAAVAAAIEAFTALREAADRADVALSDPVTGLRTLGARAVIPTPMIAAALAFPGLNAEALAMWRKEVAAALAL